MHTEFQNASDEVINKYHSRGIEYALDELEAYLHYPLIPLQRDFDNLINAIPDPSRPVSLWQNVKALRMELLMSINSMQLSLNGGRRMIRRINNPAETDEESVVADERDNTDRV
ncbi:unnamed protein product [Arabidopsis arenosa]|uniref:Uncharacterized protein n=1 Tax=Arabidopsis arenosa TaxID=38785 RepID=A0A8S2AUB4_ARAAE|nr:unnamed protein product [Arabidopsis arenosa]